MKLKSSEIGIILESLYRYNMDVMSTKHVIYQKDSRKMNGDKFTDKDVNDIKLLHDEVGALIKKFERKVKP